MKTRTAILAIFLTLTYTGLYADASSSDIAAQLETTQPIEASEAQNEIAQVVSGPATQNQSSTPTTQQEDITPSDEEQEKYVSEDNASNRKNKDNSMLYNFLLALAAIAVATAAIILVSKNKGSKVEQ